MKKIKFKKLISLFAISIFLLTNTVVVNAAEVSGAQTLTKEQKQEQKQVQATLDAYTNNVIVDGKVKVKGQNDKLSELTAAAAKVKADANANANASSTVSASSISYQSTELHRGNFMLWSITTVDYGYDGSRVTSITPDQQAGAIFPMFIVKEGNTTFAYNDQHSKSTSKYYGGGGINTAWGTLGAGTTVNDICHVYYNGGSGWE